jgi:crossover junction endodeoxyribonuclease RuvC
MARGAFLAKLAENDIPVYSYSARLAKKAAVGNGSAEKEQVALMMAAQFGIEVENILLDATDALAIAMCHAQRALHYEIGDLLSAKI